MQIIKGVTKTEKIPYCVYKQTKKIKSYSMYDQSSTNASTLKVPKKKKLNLRTM